MGERLLYSRSSPRGIICYIAKLPGGRSAMEEGLLYNTGKAKVEIVAILQ